MSWLSGLMINMFNDRTIVISGELGANASSAAVSQMLLLDATDPHQEIKLYIDSDAGLLSAGFAVCDAIEWVSAEVSTWAIGALGPVSALIVSSGAPGRRFALPDSHITFRPPDLDTSPDNHLQSAIKDKWREEMMQILSERTGKSSTTIARDLENRLRLSPTDSVGYGIVDHIVAGGKYAPQMN
ncbi:ATP-dependent Clp protease proteolytic subunit [Dietzia cinnamea]|uniref:ATP-dependent Clp protease proteolytic subunit n=1 Tax=Dietzia cinnamea TaxID=321318 RepID=UPI0021A39152|nr:ATP-dependent Clp protease proteolytic subunit [Dietzia cinnamea]MCT2097526.1 ATP-dependent Clp protease proteolytic subunit [Dietzia cinnamea]